MNSLNSENTKGLISSLNNLGAQEDLSRVRSSKRTRKGIGKMKNGRFTFRKGPLVIYGDESPLLKRTSRNLKGVDICHVSRINLLQLAPGGHLGRFVIFTQDAFAKLDELFGTATTASNKKGFTMARTMMTCSDLARIINSDQVQSKLREIRTSVRSHDKTKKNPLKNKTMMQKLNPFSKTARELEAKATTARIDARKKALAKKNSKAGRAEKAKRTKRFNMLAENLEESFKDAEKVIEDEIKAGLLDQDDSEEEDGDDE